MLAGANAISIVNFSHEQQHKEPQQQQQQETSFAVEKDTGTKIQNTKRLHTPIQLQQQFISDISTANTHVSSRYSSNSLKAALISTSSSSSAVSSSSTSSSSSSSASATTFFSLTTALSSPPSPSTSYSPTPSSSISSLSLSLATATGLLSSSAAAKQNQQQQKKKHKRFRTQMNHTQIRILRALFKDVKAPTMSDCLSIGREIGLQKRVIQVMCLHSIIFHTPQSLLLEFL